MTIISSGQLALQNAGTNPTTTADNIPLSTTITPGVDATASIWRYMEAPYGDQFANTRQWDGTIYGWAASSTYLESGTNVSGSVFNTILGNVGGTSAGNCWFNETSTQMGATSNGNTFVDSSGTTRTITAALWGIPNSTSPSPNNNTRWFLLAINGTSVPNSDNTFDKVVFSSATGSAGSTFDRTGATVRSSSDNGSTVWLWEYDTTNAYNSIDYGLGANSTAKTFKVHLAQATVSLNNGIAEEFDGDDSSDVKLSDYYAGGIYTPSGTTGIPTSGQIKFSDFLGTSKIITNTYSATGTSTMWGKGSRLRIGRVITSYYVGGAQGSGGTPSPLSSDGFGLSLTCQAAAWYESGGTAHGFRWEATSSSSTGANTTWWNKVTISRSGQTDVVLLRSAATTNAHSNYRYSIFWPVSTTNYICNGAFTWTFSS